MESNPKDGKPPKPGKPTKEPSPWVKRLAIATAIEMKEQREIWGGIDVKQISAYVDGQCTDEERARMEKAMQDYPAVRECVEAFSEDKPQAGQAGRPGKGGPRPNR